MSRVMCDMSRVICHMSRVMCTLNIYIYYFVCQSCEASGGGSVINGATLFSFYTATYITWNSGRVERMSMMIEVSRKKELNNTSPWGEKISIRKVTVMQSLP